MPLRDVGKPVAFTQFAAAADLTGFEFAFAADDALHDCFRPSYQLRAVSMMRIRRAGFVGLRGMNASRW
jgi:hypothetical protein